MFHANVNRYLEMSGHSMRIKANTAPTIGGLRGASLYPTGGLEESYSPGVSSPQVVDGVASGMGEEEGEEKGWRQEDGSTISLNKCGWTARERAVGYEQAEGGRNVGDRKSHGDADMGDIWQNMHHSASSDSACRISSVIESCGSPQRGGGAHVPAADVSQWYMMPDVVEVVLLRLRDGKDLGKCCGVNRMWGRHASSEAIWQQLVFRRWCPVGHLKRVADGPLTQNNFWKKIYTQWHQSARQPSTNYSGDRFPSFATSARKNCKTRRFERFQAGRFSTKPTSNAGGDRPLHLKGQSDSALNVSAGVWVNIVHSPDCSLELDPDANTSFLALHIVVQNFAAVPISLSAVDGVQLRLKSGAACPALYRNHTHAPTQPPTHPHPPQPDSGAPLQHLPTAVARVASPATPAAPAAPPTLLAVAQGGVVAEDPRELEAARVALEQWDFAVVGPCFFALPGHVRFEPEALEMCDQLVVAVERRVSNESLTREHARFDLAQATEITGRRREITAPFDESRIWKHYAEVG
jgi:hypothetical protein